MTDYLVRPADLYRDRDAVVAVWARNLQSHDAPTHAAKYDWYYRENPVGPARLWVLEAGEGGPIVGTAGLGLRRMRAGGERLLAGLASDFAVDQEHRLLRPAMMLQKAVIGALGNGVALIYGLPNTKSLPVFKRLGYNADVTLSRYVKILAVERFIRSRVRPKVVCGAVAGVVNPILRVLSRETWRRRRGRAVVELSGFDERFDDLWSRTGASFKVTCERNSAFLQWRYSGCPLRQYVILGLVDARESLMGYAVCSLGDDEQVTVVDLWAGSAEDVRDDLLAGAVSWARAKRAASVACVTAGATHLERGLLRFDFRFRGSGTTIAVNSPDKAPPTNWYFTLGDEDYN